MSILKGLVCSLKLGYESCPVIVVYICSPSTMSQECFMNKYAPFRNILSGNEICGVSLRQISTFQAHGRPCHLVFQTLVNR